MCIVSTLLEILARRDAYMAILRGYAFQPFLRFWLMMSLAERGLAKYHVSTLLEILACRRGS